MSESHINDSDLQFKYQSYEDDFEDSSPHTHHNQKLFAPPSQQHDTEDNDQQFETPTRFAEPKKLLSSAAKLQNIVEGGNTDREKLIQHNIKLKTQIYELTKQMDEILLKDKGRRRKEITEEDDESLRARKLELKKQQLEIQELKNKIALVKRQLENVYDNRTIVSKEDNLKSLKGELKTLEEEKTALMKIKREQNRALKSLKNQAEYDGKIIELRAQLSKVKEESKALGQKLVENERILRRSHQQYIIKQNKIKEMQQKLAHNNKDAGKERIRRVKPAISVDMIEQLEAEIEALQREKKDVEKHWQEKIGLIDQELHQKRVEEEKKLLILKEKEKELKLNEIRIKELKKLVRHNHSQNVPQQRRRTEEVQPGQFRHRRNIKYLDSQN